MARPREPIGLPVLSAPEVPLYDGNLEADLRLVSRSRLAETIAGVRGSFMLCSFR